MLYEWRTYEALPGKLPALHTHLEVAARLFRKHGLGVLGFWTEEIGTGGQVTYMWIYTDLEDRQQKLAAFGADAAWQQQVAEETEKEGAIVARVRNTMLQLTPYSPAPQLRTKVQEWRVYEAMPGRLPDLHNRFANHTLRLFEKHGMENIGYWTEVFGTSNRLVYMLGYPGLGERERSWAAFQRDPEWQQARTESEKNGPLVAKAYNQILRPTGYSPRG
jgi:NIPSNAP